MSAMELLTGPFAQAIGWALLHLVWQATIVAAILAATLALLPRESANVRYAASCTALAFVFALFVATTIRSYDPAVAPVQTAATEGEVMNIPLTEVPALIVATAAASWRDRALDAMGSARQSLPTVVAFWILGVVFLSSRLLVSWVRVRALVTTGAVEASAEWQQVAARISEALGLRRAVRLLESAAVEVPSVLGTLRPVILLPASALTGLTPAQLEMVLAHELAHIRRHDFLMNLLQAFVETLMFYHPAVWWMSRRVRIERENCCDDLAVAVCGNALQYAKALTRLEELRGGALPVVVAANGGSLLDRIRRIVASGKETNAVSSRWAAAVAMLAIFSIALIVPSLPALAQREETPAPATASVEVVEAAEPAEEPAEEPEPAEPAEPEEETDHGVTYIDEDLYEIEAPEPPEFAEAAEAPEAPEPPEAPEAPAPLPPGAVRMPRGAVLPLAPMPPMEMAVLGRLHFNDDEDDDRKTRSRRRNNDGDDNDGELSVDELVGMRAVGVTPEYIREMRAIFPGISTRAVTGLRAVGVTPAYVSEMRASGLTIDDASDISGLKAVGVTAAFISDMRAAGFEIKSGRDATGLRALGVTSAWVRDMRAAGLELRTASEASGLKAVGVTAEYIADMRAAGFAMESAREITGLKAVGVTPAYIREMAAAGVKIQSAKDATGMKAVGVTPEFVRRLAAAGYTNLTVRELTSMAAHGVDSDFIREMQQYRKNN